MASQPVRIKREVVMRSIVTDQLKDQISTELQHAADEINQRLAQLDLQTGPYLRQLQKTDLQQAMQVRQQIETEKARQVETRDAILERKTQLEVLENGEEIVRGTVESFVDVNEGDNLAQLLAGTEIVTKDDIVVEIRQRSINAEDSAPSLIVEPNA